MQLDLYAPGLVPANQQAYEKLARFKTRTIAHQYKYVEHQLTQIFEGPVTRIAHQTKIVDIGNIGSLLLQRLEEIFYHVYDHSPTLEKIVWRVYVKIVSDVVYFSNGEAVIVAEMLKYLPERTGLEDILASMSAREFECLKECSCQYGTDMFLMIRRQVPSWQPGVSYHVKNVYRDSILMDIYQR